MPRALRLVGRCARIPASRSFQEARQTESVGIDEAVLRHCLESGGVHVHDIARLARTEGVAFVVFLESTLCQHETATSRLRRLPGITVCRSPTSAAILRVLAVDPWSE